MRARQVSLESFSEICTDKKIITNANQLDLDNFADQLLFIASFAREMENQGWMDQCPKVFNWTTLLTKIRGRDLSWLFTTCYCEPITPFISQRHSFYCGVYCSSSHNIAMTLRLILSNLYNFLLTSRHETLHNTSTSSCCITAIIRRTSCSK